MAASREHFKLYWRHVKDEDEFVKELNAISKVSSWKQEYLLTLDIDKISLQPIGNKPNNHPFFSKRSVHLFIVLFIIPQMYRLNWQNSISEINRMGMTEWWLASNSGAYSAQHDYQSDDKSCHFSSTATPDEEMGKFRINHSSNLRYRHP